MIQGRSNNGLVAPKPSYSSSGNLGGMGSDFFVHLDSECFVRFSLHFAIANDVGVYDTGTKRTDIDIVFSELHVHGICQKNHG